MIVEDQPLFAEALGRLLQARGFAVVATAASERQALESVRSKAPDLVLLEIALLESEIGDFARAVRDCRPQAKLVALTSVADDRAVLASLAAGASGYLLKSTSADRLGSLLADLLDGQVVLSPGLAQRVFHACAQRKLDPQPRPLLTPRELDLLRELVNGHCSSRSLARALSLSPKTVRFHVRNILDKLHVHDRAQAVALAMRNGLVPIPPPASPLPKPPAAVTIGYPICRESRAS